MSSHIQVELDALNNAHTVAVSAGIGPAQVVYGLNMRGLTKMPLNHRVGIVSDAGASALQALASRLQHVRILCGEWSRALSSQSLVGNQHQSGGGRTGHTGVLLDGPYIGTEGLYSARSEGVFRDICQWAEGNGDDPHLRIVVCGYEGDWSPPVGWKAVGWKARAAFASDKGNGERERLWLSPHCLPVVERSQRTLMLDEVSA